MQPRLTSDLKQFPGLCFLSAEIQTCALASGLLKRYFFFFKLCVGVCVYIFECAGTHQGQRPWIPAAGITGSSEPLDVGAEN